MSKSSKWISPGFMILGVLALMPALAGPSLAQEFRGTITGRVLDPSEAVMPGVSIIITNVETGQKVNLVSNETGQYVAPLLQVGTYRIEAEITGFKHFVQENVDLRVGDRLQIDVRLQLGEMSEIVSVTAGAPLLETTNGSAGFVVDTKRLQELPIAHGNPYLLIGLTPGTSMDGDQKLNRPFEPTHIVAYAMDGTRANTSDVTLDGVANTAIANPGQITASYVPPTDAVAEFKVQTATFDVKVGQTAGGLVNISLKSGTNSPHGTAYYTKMTPDMVANEWFGNRSGVPRAEEKYDRYGASLNGPVVLPGIYKGRDRTFFMYTFEGMKDTRPRGDTYTVPTLKEREGDFSELLALGSKYQIYNPFTRVKVGSRYQAEPFKGNIIPPELISPVAKKILSFVPKPLNDGTTADHQNNLPRPNMAEITNYYTHVFRVDHTFSPKHRFFIRGNVYKRDSLSKDYYESDATGQLQDYFSRGASADDVFTFSPTFIMNIRYGYNRFIRLTVPKTGFNYDLTSLLFPASLNNAISPDQRMFPYVRVRDSGSVDSLVSQNIGERRYMDTHSFVAAFTKMLGAHQIEFGTEFRAYRHNRYNINSSMSGQYVFDRTWTRGPLDNSPEAPMGQAMAAFLLGLPTAGSSNTFIQVVSNFAEQSTAWGFYLQDNWRITPRLNVTLGLRYELETPETERYNRSVRGFDAAATLAESAAAEAAYAANLPKNPFPELPADQFKVRGGLLFAGVNGQPRTLWNKDTNNFMPRIGFAYSWKDKTVIRGGYAIFFSSMGVRRTDVIQNGYAKKTPFSPTTDNIHFTATLDNPYPSGLLAPTGNTLGIETDLGENITFFNPNPLAPKMQRWQLGVQRELPGKMVVEVAYVGNRGTELQPSNTTSSGALPRDLNAIPNKYLSTSLLRDQTAINYLSATLPNPFYKLFPGSIATNSTIARANLLKPYPQFGTIYSTSNDGYSWYHAMQLQFDKRFTSGIYAHVSYTWSKAMDAIDYQNAGDPLPYYCISPQDHTHRLSASGSYELPFGRGRRFLAGIHPVADALLGGWQLQAVYNRQSGPPLTWSALNVVYTGNLADIPKNTRSVDQWFNTAGFLRDSTQQPHSTYQLATWPIRLSGARADGINLWDMSMIKVFRIRETARIQFRAEATNIFNHAGFRAPATNPYNLDFGKVTDTANFARQIQLGVKFVF